MRAASLLATLALAALVPAACKVDTKTLRADRSTDSAAVVIARTGERILPGGLVPPQRTVVPAFSATKTSAAEGAKLFTGMNCDGCHGGGAVGAVGPSLTDGRWRYGGSDADIFRSIAEGRPRGMPAFGGVLQPEMIWRLVAYIKSLPKPSDVSTEAW